MMDNNIKKRLLKRAIELKAIEYGEFTLASGMKSNFYFDGRLLSLDPESSSIISDWVLGKLMELQVNYIGGPAVAAVPIIGSIVHNAFIKGYSLSGFFIRSERKDHGLQKKIEGNLPNNSSVVIIDDTMSTGGSLIDSMNAVKENNCEILQVLTILDRKLGGSEKLLSLGYNYSTILEVNSSGEII